MELFLSSEEVLSICINLTKPKIFVLRLLERDGLCHKKFLEKLCNSRSLTFPFPWFGFLLIPSFWTWFP